MQKLTIRRLCKSFGDVRALKNVDLDLAAGKMLAILGPSGCGKTTLLRSIAGFEAPDSGFIGIDGHPVFDSHVNVKPERRRIGYVPQEGVLFPHLTVAQNVAFGLSRRASNLARVDEMLELVGMSGLGARMPHQLSGGQQQRIALARALAPSPSLVLLDEPFSALDAGLRAALRQDVRASLQKTGATAIMVTHDQEEALSMADYVTVMRDGECIQTADPVSLYKYPADLHVAEFIGDATVLETTIHNGTVSTPFGNLTVAQGCPQDCDLAKVILRPEQFVIRRSSDAACCQVIRTVFHGHDALVGLKLTETFGGIDHIQARVLGTPEFALGDYVGLHVNGEVMAYASDPIAASQLV